MNYQLIQKMIIEPQQHIWEADEFVFCFSDWYKYRGLYHDGAIVFLIEKNAEQNAIPFLWFNKEQQRFNAFYQARCRGYGGLQGDSSQFNRLGIKDFKHYKKLQKIYKPYINELALALCYPLKYKLEKEFDKLNNKQEKVNKI